MKRGSLEKKGAHKKVKKKAWIEIKRLKCTKMTLKVLRKEVFYRESVNRFSQFTNGNHLEGVFTQEWENDRKLTLQKMLLSLFTFILQPLFTNSSKSAELRVNGKSLKENTNITELKCWQTIKGLFRACQSFCYYCYVLIHLIFLFYHSGVIGWLDSS